MISSPMIFIYKVYQSLNIYTHIACDLFQLLTTEMFKHFFLKQYQYTFKNASMDIFSMRMYFGSKFD